jgi:hypothetical protein
MGNVQKHNSCIYVGICILHQIHISVLYPVNLSHYSTVCSHSFEFCKYKLTKKKNKTNMLFKFCFYMEEFTLIIYSAFVTFGVCEVILI